MSQAPESAGELRTDKHGEPVDVFDSSAHCYFDTETEELVFLTAEGATDVENHANEMMRIADEFHSAQDLYSRLLEQYEEKIKVSAQPSPEEKKLSDEISKAEDELNKKRQAVRDALGDYSHKDMGYGNVTELLPVARGKNKRPFSYVRKKALSDLKSGGKLQNVDLTAKDKNGKRESFYVKDKNGRSRIDSDKLKKQLTTLDVKKLSLELKDVLKWAGAEDALKDLQKDVTLFDWAESWNEKLVVSEQLSENTDIAAGAQVMRYVQNVGASVEFDPDKGRVALKGEYKNSLTLASGMCQVSSFAPDRVGWSLLYTTEKGNVFDMGKVRLATVSTVSGFMGATTVIEGQLQVVTKGEQQLLAGKPGSKLPRFQERKDHGAVFFKQMKAEDEGLEVSGEAFAGAKIEGQLKGSLQWLKPTPPADLEGPMAGILTASSDYVDFCSLAPSIGAMVGIGAGGRFHCAFIDGKFCFHVAASLCWGAGAKGGLAFEVGTAAIVEFGSWLVYQLYKLNYGFFELINSEAFGVFSKYCVMRFGEGQRELYSQYRNASVKVEQVTRDFKDFVDTVLDDIRDHQAASERRNELAKNVLKNKQDLLWYTPEAKGMLLYLLTRHGKWDDLDLENYGSLWGPDRYRDRKDAVIWVLRSIQTRREWQKVLSRISRDGESLVNNGTNVSEVVRRKEQDLVDFLQLGFDRDQDLVKERNRVMAILDVLKDEISWGYALAMNNTIYYKLNTGDNPHYPRCLSAGACGEVLV